MSRAYGMHRPDGTYVQDFLVRKSEINRTDGRPRHRWKDIYYKSEIPHKSLTPPARSFRSFPVILKLWITSERR